MEVRSTLRLLAFAAMACKGSTHGEHQDTRPAHVHDPDEPPGYHRPDTEVSVRITATGLDPAAPHVTAGTATLVVTRTSDKACAKNVLVYFTPGASVYRPLALDKPESFTGTFDASGILALECERDLGKLTVAPQ